MDDIYRIYYVRFSFIFTKNQSVSNPNEYGDEIIMSINF